MTIEAHVKAKQVALGRSIAARKKVYLDLNFWITARNAALGIRTDGPAQKLLHHLRRGVAGGKLICPVSDNVFLELMKQPLSEDRRIGTARLIDELGLGVSMIPSDQRVCTEIYLVMHQLMQQPGELHPMQELVWTKVCHIVGQAFPVLDDVDPETMLMLQRGFIDELWKTPLTDMITMIGDAGDRSDNYKELSAETNRERDKHADDITNFKRAYEIELRGSIDACGHLAADALGGIAERQGLAAPRQTDGAAWETAVNAGKNVLWHAFGSKGAASTVRTMHIEAVIHAAMRMEKPRRFKPNDFYDFHHAAGALAYCDAFLTDGPLHELVARKQLQLLEINNCQVVSDLDAAVELVRELAAGSAD